MNKHLLYLIFCLVVLNTNAQYYYLDCATHPASISFYEKFDSLNEGHNDSTVKYLDGMSNPLTKSEYYERLKLDRLPLNHYRIDINPSKNFRKYIIQSFSRNYLFTDKNYMPNHYKMKIGPLKAEPIDFTPMDELYFQPLLSVSISEYQEQLATDEYFHFSENMKTLFLENISNYVDYELDSISPESDRNNNIPATAIGLINSFHSIFIDYENHKNYSYLERKFKKIIGTYRNKPIRYSAPYKDSRRLGEYYATHNSEISAFLDGKPITHQIENHPIGFKFHLSLVSIDTSGVGDNNYIYAGLKSSYNIELINDYVGLVYLDKTQKEKTLWLNKKEMYSILNDDLFENTLEMLLTNKLRNKISNEKY